MFERDFYLKQLLYFSQAPQLQELPRAKRLILWFPCLLFLVSADSVDCKKMKGQL